MPAVESAAPGAQPLTFPEVARYANKCIRMTVRTVIGRYGFTVQDREDLESELRVHLIGRLHRYRPGRGAKTNFIHHVVTNRICQIVALRKTELSRFPIGVALDETLKDEDGNAFRRSDMVDHDEYLVASDRQSRTAHESTELAIDLEIARRTLPPDLADLFERLRDQTVRDVCDETGAPKSSVLYRKWQIKRRFREHGLDGYFRAPPSF